VATIETENNEPVVKRTPKDDDDSDSSSSSSKSAKDTKKGGFNFWSKFGFIKNKGKEEEVK